MTISTTMPEGLSSSSRAVLVWHAERDETHVEPNVAAAAGFLGVTADAVIAGIDAGDAVAGWFVDWAVTPSTQNAPER